MNMLWTEEKLGMFINELSESRYRDTVRISAFRYREDALGEIGSRPPQAEAWPEVSIGHRWEGRDVYVWIYADVNVPASWTNRRIVGRFNFGRTGAGTNSGFESLLYLNGDIYQGVDSNHQEVFFSPETSGTTVSLQFRLWSGLEGGGGKPRIQEHRLEQAEIAWLDETADDLYFTAKAVLESVMVLHTSSPERVMLLTALNLAFREIDWSRPASDRFYHSLERAQGILRTELKKLEREHPVTVTCIGHTHIDVAWLWRLKHTREKAARSFSTVLRLMEQFPDYIFLQTQPQLYDDIKHDYPELYEQIRKRVAEGKWEAGGAMWLEADCNVTSGESLVRQIMTGIRFFRKEFGVECKYLWLPDVFGYSWALPQILQKSGIDTFMTTKISWSEYNRFPHDTFRWRGIDGTEVLAHFITTPDGGGVIYTYNGVITAKTVNGIWDNYRDKSVNRELLLSYGYGDGGGGVNREMLEMRRRLNEIGGNPQVVTGRVDEYFDRLHQTVDKTEEYVHTWNGELYLEYHRGTYTSQAYVKMMNRKLELLYREAEWQSVLQACLHGGVWSGYSHDELSEGWKIILRNQFHDILPGSSIREVYEDAREEYAEAERLGRKVLDGAQHSVVAGKQPVSVNFVAFNSTPWEQSDLIHVSSAEPRQTGRWTNAAGQPLHAQSTDDGWLVQVSGTPSMGFQRVRFQPDAKGGQTEPSSFHYSGDGLTTPYYDIRWNEKGHLTSVYDRKLQREVLYPGERGNVLQIFEDKPRRHNAWDIDIYYQEKMKEVVDIELIELAQSGPLRAVVRFRWRYMDSTVSQDMIVYAHSGRIDFQTEIDWQERQTLMKVCFPVNVHATEATYDIQFGNVKRPTHWNTSWDYARFETVGHQWADLSERGYGVSLMNDCKYGYDIKDHRMRLSLLRSPIRPDAEADRGLHKFTYSLYPHPGDWMEGNTVREAWQLNQPMIGVPGESELPAYSMFTVSAQHVMIDAVKKAEDGDEIVLRLHEFSGARGEVEIRCGFPAASWCECNLLEEPVASEQTGGVIRFSIAPYEIKTFLIKG